MAAEPTAALTADHPHAALVREAHEAFKRGDREAVDRLFHEDIRWVVTGESQTATVDHGMDEVLASFGKVMELTNGTYEAVGFDYLGGERHAAALAHVTAERDGKRLDVDEVVIFEVRDGRLANAMHIAYDQRAWDEFFA
jgi:ketosteroid isomerase-like protein